MPFSPQKNFPAGTFIAVVRGVCLLASARIRHAAGQVSDGLHRTISGDVGTRRWMADREGRLAKTVRCVGRISYLPGWTDYYRHKREVVTRATGIECCPSRSHTTTGSEP